MHLDGCHFIVPKNCLRSKVLIYRGGCSPKGSHKAKAHKGTVEATSAASAAWTAATAVPNFIVGICDDMTWNDMKWYEMICDNMWGFDGIWWGLISFYIVLLHAPKRKKSKKCQVGGPGGLPFYSPQKLPSVRGSNFIGACSPTGCHKAKARKGTVEAASALQQRQLQKQQSLIS